MDALDVCVRFLRRSSSHRQKKERSNDLKTVFTVVVVFGIGLTHASFLD
jgi:hypothetical protein